MVQFGLSIEFMYYLQSFCFGYRKMNENYSLFIALEKVKQLDK